LATIWTVIKMKLGYVITYVPDVAATVAFYEQAFGLMPRFVHESGTYSELDTGSTALAFADEAFVSQSGISFEPARPTSPPAAVEIALVTDDVAAAVARALAAGAAAVKLPESKPWGQTVAYVRDLNGLLVELCTPVAAG
jgi:catechol 2,3-dioxygenase-like lactoylglutathione lyase family enzyme